jgi:hypothetical protein
VYRHGCPTPTDGDSDGGGNVYIVGIETDGNGVETPCYWLNGKEKSLPITGSDGYAIAVALR